MWYTISMNTNARKVIIVEGKNDQHRVKKLLPDIPVLTTNGSAVSKDFLELVKELGKEAEIILLLDPDYNGEAIRKKIVNVCPNASHIFVKKEQAISKNKKKLGVEHVPLDMLAMALQEIKQSKYKNNITIQDLYELGLAGKDNSKYLRQKLCDKLSIGYVNAKQLVERLNLFNYTLDYIKEIL